MLQAAWNPDTGFLPAQISARLLMGSVGSRHLMDLALEAMRLAGDGGPQADSLANAARHMLLAAWEDEPLHGALAKQAHALLAQHDPADPALPMLAALAGAWREPQDLRYFQRLAENLEFEKLHRFLDRQVEQEPDNLYWLQQAWAVAEADGDLDALAARLARAWPKNAPALKPLKAFVLGNLAILLRDFSAAAELYRAATLAASAWLKPVERRAECLHRMGEREAARDLWAEVLGARPWHASLALHVHDLVNGLDQTVADPSGSLAALLYTWNKAEDLDRVLQSLAASRGWDLLVALDNGSTDATPQVLAAWRGRLGAERMRIETLPVNVGAPAARNWLKAMDEVRACDFIAYLDDDAIMPPDWAGRLAAAEAAYPEAGVWGCRVMDAHAPAVIQCADQHITLPGEMRMSRQELDRQIADSQTLNKLRATPFLLSALPSLTPGYGLFEYVRPCTAVTGCCHMFRAGDLLEGPDFAISLSPSQYDDLERDLRMNLGGRTACYQGFLAVDHLKRTGKAARGQTEQFGSGLANRYKMYRLFTPDQVWAITAFSRDVVRRDFLAKAAVLDQALEPGSGPKRNKHKDQT